MSPDLYSRGGGRAGPEGMLLHALFTLMLLGSTLAYDPNGVHILFLTDCTEYSNWQAVGMAFAYKNSGQAGHITRVMCCTDDEKANYPPEMLEIMETHIAPSFAKNNKTDDFYPAFNKPGAVLDFMTNGKPQADWMLVIDSDMLLRHPFDPTKHKMQQGKALSADYRYMVGCTNELAPRHIPEIGKRNDTLAGPYGRWCDQVGGWVFMHKDDLTRVAPLWLSMTVDVREDPESWRLSGDQYVEKGGRPWISEMYGYAFACAKSGVWHQWDLDVMHYPSYTPRPESIPKLIHYGLLFEVPAGNFSFDKHWQYVMNVRSCPPWDLSMIKSRPAGLFQHPPRISAIEKEGGTVRYGHLMAIETAATINAGFCYYHLKNCAPSKQLLDECQTAWEIYKEVKEAEDAYETEVACYDALQTSVCVAKVQEGACSSDRKSMLQQCKFSCEFCHKDDAPLAKALAGPASLELQELLRNARAQLRPQGGSSGRTTKDTTLGSEALTSSLGQGEAVTSDVVSPSSELDSKTGSDTGSSSGGTRTTAEASSDPDDLSLQRHSDPVVSPKDDDMLKVARRSLGPSENVAWHKPAALLALLLMVLYALTRALKAGRRARSGLRSE